MILTDVQVLAAGTKIERDTEKGKPTGERRDAARQPRRVGAADARRDGGQDSARAAQPARLDNPSTRGIRPATLLGTAPPVRRGPGLCPRWRLEAPRPGDPGATVEIIRGDKRAREVVRQEQE